MPREALVSITTVGARLRGPFVFLANCPTEKKTGKI